jgi:single-strand DNA-binding protein
MALTTQVTLSGNLTRDVEVRFTQAGQPVASFTIATTPRSYDKDTKQYVDGEAIFTNCVLWGKPAEHLAASAGKGTRVIASGALKSRTYTTKEGEQKTATELVVDEMGISVQFAAPGSARPVARPSAAPGDAGGALPAGDEIPW